MYVVGDSTYCFEVQDTLPDLQSIIASFTGKKNRKIDRHIQLCLAGALQCTKDFELPKNSDIVIATGSGTVSTCADIMKTLYLENNPPKPLHFVNALGNTACFYLCQQLGLEGSSIAVSEQQLSFEAALVSAQMQFECNESNGIILVGGADEVLLPIAEHTQRLKAPSEVTGLYEGSHWLAVTNNQHKAAYALINEPDYAQSEQELAAKLADSHFDKYFFNMQPSKQLMQTLCTETADVHCPAPNIWPHGTYGGHNLALAANAIKTGQIKSACVISQNYQSTELAFTTLTHL